MKINNAVNTVHRGTDRSQRKQLTIREYSIAEIKIADSISSTSKGLIAYEWLLLTHDALSDPLSDFEDDLAESVSDLYGETVANYIIQNDMVNLDSEQTDLSDKYGSKKQSHQTFFFPVKFLEENGLENTRSLGKMINTAVIIVSGLPYNDRFGRKDVIKELLEMGDSNWNSGMEIRDEMSEELFAVVSSDEEIANAVTNVLLADDSPTEDSATDGLSGSGNDDDQDTIKTLADLQQACQYGDIPKDNRRRDLYAEVLEKSLDDAQTHQVTTRKWMLENISEVLDVSKRTAETYLSALQNGGKLTNVTVVPETQHKARRLESVVKSINNRKIDLQGGMTLSSLFDEFGNVPGLITLQQKIKNHNRQF